MAEIMSNTGFEAVRELVEDGEKARWRVEATKAARRMYPDELERIEERIAEKRAQQRAIASDSLFERRTMDAGEKRNFDLAQSYVHGAQRDLDTLLHRALPSRWR